MAHTLEFNGVLFFPVTPFDASDTVDLAVLEEHVARGLGHAPGGVFPACGTGEFHALSRDERVAVVAHTVRTVDSAVPVVAGVGGSVGESKVLARSFQDAGADALLVLPPYLVGGTADGLVAYVEAIAGASDLPVIVYHRQAATYTVEAMRRLAQDPRVIGFKDGVGDIGLAQQIVLAVRRERPGGFAFFNGLLTAEMSQSAYSAIGIPLYSSAVFAMAPAVANLFYSTFESEDEPTRRVLLDEFYAPLVRLRDQTPGFAVSLIKAGLRLHGLAVGSVRAPLVDPNSAQLQELERILATGNDLVESLIA